MKYSYTFNDGRVETATTVRELLSKGVPRKLSRDGYLSYMLSGAVQEPFTLIEGVRSLSETVPVISTVDSGISHDEAQAQVTRAIEEAVRKAVNSTMEATGRSDLPAAFLSGGIDSTAIVAVMRRLYPKERIRTYCVIHEDPRTDERQWAQLAAKHNNTDHTELLLTADMFKKGIVSALDSYDLPSVDGINNYYASKFVSEAGVKAIFSGEGGDELFAGYGEFAKPRQAYSLASKLNRLGILKGVATWFGVGLTKWATAEKWKKLGQLLAANYDSYFVTRRQFDPGWIERLSGGGQILDVKAHLSGLFAEIQRHCGTLDMRFDGDIVNRCSWMELRHNLRSMYLRDGIQTSAPFGLDILAPLMDEELVSLVMSLPGRMKCHSEISKHLLVAAANGEGSGISPVPNSPINPGIPNECIFRQKQGFALPFDLYIREGLKGQMDEFFMGGDAILFDKDELAKVWQLYVVGKCSWLRVWQLFVLEYWCKKNGVTW